VADNSFKTFDELVTWAAWQIIEGITAGKPIRQVIYSILMVARQAKIGEKP
jgi:hypothetical protein